MKIIATLEWPNLFKEPEDFSGEKTECLIDVKFEDIPTSFCTKAEWNDLAKAISCNYLLQCSHNVERALLKNFS